jgi:hypothetical protein
MGYHVNSFAEGTQVDYDNRYEYSVASQSEDEAKEPRPSVLTKREATASGGVAKKRRRMGGTPSYAKAKKRLESDTENEEEEEKDDDDDDKKRDSDYGEKKKRVKKEKPTFKVTQPIIIEGEDGKEEQIYSRKFMSNDACAPDDPQRVTSVAAVKRAKGRRLLWTQDEEDALILGLMKYGYFAWTEILKDSEFAIILRNRSGVDLKDKYRVIKKSGKYELSEIEQSNADFRARKGVGARGPTGVKLDKEVGASPSPRKGKTPAPGSPDKSTGGSPRKSPKKSPSNNNSEKK